MAQAVIVKAYSVRHPSVREAIVKAGIPHTETKNAAKSTRTFTIQAPSPTHYTPNSLAALCWNALKFPYHHAVKNRNTVACSNV
ncbi:uncharacterized protein B0H64DRAFT_476537 [Chaetomium fimeti]|uniref:Uncharacterized protein n=1 Tax=Chaetomium fimeti TaxID=1854472 RepID=A0AAE0HAU1_9PEZI|nr:hypothetical protein B0H64DRAFT_476537 [Chaetomium fimeti]